MDCKVDETATSGRVICASERHVGGEDNPFQVSAPRGSGNCLWSAVEVTHNQPGKPHADNKGCNGMEPASIGPIFQVEITIQVQDNKVQGPPNKRNKD